MTLALVAEMQEIQGEIPNEAKSTKLYYLFRNIQHKRENLEMSFWLFLGAAITGLHKTKYCKEMSTKMQQLASYGCYNTNENQLFKSHLICNI